MLDSFDFASFNQTFSLELATCDIIRHLGLYHFFKRYGNKRNYGVMESAISIVHFFTAIPVTRTSLKFKTHYHRTACVKTAASIISYVRPLLIVTASLHFTLLSCDRSVCFSTVFSAALTVGDADSTWRVSRDALQRDALQRGTSSAFSTSLTGYLSELAHIVYGEECTVYREAGLICYGQK